jgi:hypothetical protein
MAEIEIQLWKSLGWSLHDIDETDTANLMAFINHLTGKRPVRRDYIDQVNWL